MCPTTASLHLRIGLACLPALAGCGGDEPPEAAVPADPPAAAPPAEAAVPRARPYAPEELIRLDLSEETVAALSLEELWELGVQHLAWPAALPAGADKQQLHQRLLEAKYRDVGDFDVGY